ncbi:hypothetical protein [Hoeflea sp.]|uniref:hypothetical protein n=1 Tax=Hoeflea sp. TaxID=1940281 RepID=UPI003B51BD9A
MRIFVSAIAALVIALTTPLHAQDEAATVTLGSPQYPVSMELPSALTIDGASTDLELELLLDATGNVKNLTAWSNGAQRVGLCEPICWNENGRRVCLFPIGCPGGGGGGGGVLLEKPLLVEINQTPGSPDGSVAKIEVMELEAMEPMLKGSAEIKLPSQ